MSRPNVADWQYLGVDKFTLGLEWNCGRKARKGHICEDTFAYGSYSSKDITLDISTGLERIRHCGNRETSFVVWPCNEKRRHECCKAT